MQPSGVRPRRASSPRFQIGWFPRQHAPFISLSFFSPPTAASGHPPPLSVPLTPQQPHPNKSSLRADLFQISLVYTLGNASTYFHPVSASLCPALLHEHIKQWIKRLRTPLCTYDNLPQQRTQWVCLTYCNYVKKELRLERHSTHMATTQTRIRFSFILWPIIKCDRFIWKPLNIFELFQKDWTIIIKSTIMNKGCSIINLTDLFVWETFDIL